MPRAVAVAIAIVLATFTSVVAAIPVPPPVFSANREFSVELSESGHGELLVAVSHHAGESKALTWSRKTHWKADFPRGISSVLWQIQTFITSDGQTVILRDSVALLDKPSNELRILFQDEKKDLKLRPFDLPELTINRPQFPTGAAGAVYHVQVSLLDFLTPEEDEYALWFAPSDRWFIVSLKELSSGIIRDEARIKVLNEMGRQRALDLIQEHQPPPLRKAATALRERLARMIPSVVSPSAPAYPLLNAAPGYFFITARRQPSDRKYIDQLFRFPEKNDWNQGSLRFADGGTELWATVHPRELLLGDFLARMWDGSTNADWYSASLSVRIPDEPLRSLGSVKTVIALPIHLPDNPGAIWAILIPAHLKTNEWSTTDELWSCRLISHSGPTPVHTDRPNLSIKGLRPGEYRLKLVWERRPGPFGKKPGHYAPQPGDYESAESPPFVIEAGKTSELPAIACTNRIGNDPTAYAEDEAWAAKWKGDK